MLVNEIQSARVIVLLAREVSLLLSVLLYLQMASVELDEYVIHCLHHMQAKWCQASGCNVWQGSLCDAAADIWTSIGSDEPSRCHGYQLRASSH